MITTIRNFIQRKGPFTEEKDVVEAYDIWAGSYDSQPGNLMLKLDEMVFTDLAGTVSLKNKRIADIGCGTGRHWQRMYNRNPGIIIGFDVSPGMLMQLKRKFPNAITQLISDNLLDAVPAAFVDCIVTTLTIAHIKNIDEAIAAWAGILKPGGDIIITDFHPELLAKGGKRSFQHNGKSLAVVNYIHPVEEVKNILAKHGFLIHRETEKYIDEDVKPWYQSQNALHVYERFKGMPVIYGIHLKKQYAAE